MKKIIRLTAIALAILTLTFCTVACRQQEKDITLDIDQLAKALSEVKYVDEMVKLDDAVVATSYALTSDAKKAVVYGASGATPEEIIVAEYEDIASAKAAISKYSDRLAAQKKVFDTYNAEYRPLLDQMILQQAGKYIIYCVSSDYTAASKIVDSYIGNVVHIAK